MDNLTKTVHYCCVCRRNSRHEKRTLGFFRFPKDEKRFAEWKAVLQLEKIASYSAQYCYEHFRICSNHFEEKMFAGMGQNKLKKDAVPSQLSGSDGKYVCFESVEEPEPVASTSQEHMNKKVKESLTEYPAISNIAHVGVTRIDQEELKQNLESKGKSVCFESVEEPEPVASTSQEHMNKKVKESLTEYPAISNIAHVGVTRVDQEELKQNLESKASQTSQILSCGTPRKVQLRKRIKSLKKKMNTSQESNTQTAMTIDNITKFLGDHVSSNLANFLKTQITLAKKKPKGSRYSNEYKQFALTIHFLGPKVYKFLSKMFRLPSRSTLQRVTAKWDIRPGISNFLFEALKLKVEVLDNCARDCILCLDEMSLKAHLYYNLSQDEIVGLHQTPSEKSFQPAQNVLVLMARGINANWKQPLAYFFVNSSCPVVDLENIIFETIKKMKAIGLKVLSLVSDHGSNFFKLVKKLGVSVEKPYFICEDMKVFYMIDVPHLLKSTRNNFFKYNFQFGGGITDKKYLEEFYASDKQEKFRLAAKLTSIHLFPNNFQKMKVKYAAQVFSATVSAAMNAYISFHKLPSAASKTVEFIEKMDNLFDVFNSSKFNKAKSFCRPFMGTESQKKFLKDMLNFFNSLTIMEGNKNITKRMKFTFGWKLSISAFLGMWDILNEKKINRIHTRRLNQDCLENFFGKIRQQSGNCKNPTPIQFQRAFKKMFGISYLDNSEGANCLDEFDKILASITPEVIQSCQILVSQPSYMKSLQIETKDYNTLNITEKNGFVYVGGYFIKKVLERHKCISCSKFAKEHTELDESTIYSFFRAYPNSKNDTFGNLKMPNIRFLEYIHALEKCFCEMFPSLAIKEDIGKNLKNYLSKISFISPCLDFPIDYLVALFVRVRIYYTIKFLNQDIKSSSKKKKPNPKLTILQHM